MVHCVNSKEATPQIVCWPGTIDLPKGHRARIGCYAECGFSLSSSFTCLMAKVGIKSLTCASCSSWYASVLRSCSISHIGQENASAISFATPCHFGCWRWNVALPSSRFVIGTSTGILMPFERSDLLPRLGLNNAQRPLCRESDGNHYRMRTQSICHMTSVRLRRNFLVDPTRFTCVKEAR